MRLSACAKAYSFHATTEVFVGGGELEGTVDLKNTIGHSTMPGDCRASLRGDLVALTAEGCLNDQTFQSEVCRLPFEYGIALSMQLIRAVLTRQHVPYNAVESERHSVFYWLLPA